DQGDDETILHFPVRKDETLHDRRLDEQTAAAVVRPMAMQENLPRAPFQRDCKPKANEDAARQTIQEDQRQGVFLAQGGLQATRHYILHVATVVHIVPISSRATWDGFRIG